MKECADCGATIPIPKRHGIMINQSGKEVVVCAHTALCADRRYLQAEKASDASQGNWS